MSDTNTIPLATSDLTGALGVIPASGIAVILGVTLVYGVKGRGKKKIASGPAQVIGIFAELAFLRAESFWRDIGAALQAIPTSIAGNGELGGIGMGTVCCLLVAISLFARIVPVTGALLGVLMGGAFEAADGSVWNAITSLFSVPFELLGA